MASDGGKHDEDALMKELWSNEDYVLTKKKADDESIKNAPLLSKIATSVDIRCSGSLGLRSVRKQIQALFHYAIGNQKIRSMLTPISHQLRLSLLGQRLVLGKVSIIHF